jgi:hypothetical protein
MDSPLAGLLPYIFQRSDAFKRTLRDAVSNPRGLLDLRGGELQDVTNKLGGLLSGDPAREADASQVMDGMAGGLLGGTKLYKFAPEYRPANATNMPKGWVETGPASTEHKFGTVTYDRHLTPDELRQFELRPLDPSHPQNLKRDFENFHERFMNDFSGNGSYAVNKGNTHYAVTESARPEGQWQVTAIDAKTGAPTGHESFDDFDELSKYVWGLSR